MKPRSNAFHSKRPEPFLGLHDEHGGPISGYSCVTEFNRMCKQLLQEINKGVTNDN